MASANSISTGSLVLLSCVARAVLKVGVKALSQCVPFGEPIYELANATYSEWSKVQSDEQKHLEMEQLTHVRTEELRVMARAVVAELAAQASREDQEVMLNYLMQVPASIRSGLRRPGDPSGRTIPGNLNLRRGEDLLQFLPQRLPRFKMGDRPLRDVDLELEELLGVGGFGEVWRARNPRISSAAPVALKFCLDKATASALEREAGLLNRIQRDGRHPGIVTLQRTYLSADPPCLEYEYIEGGDVSWMIRDWHRQGGPKPEEAARVVMRLAEIVGFAHRMKPAVVHRDLKPANILIQEDARGKRNFKVADFGIGGLAAQQEILAATRRGTTLGVMQATAACGAYTLHYASPQQQRGEPADPRDDVYALGVIWHQLLTGDMNSGAPTGMDWMRELKKRGMSDGQLRLMVSCIEANPGKRMQDAAELASNLERLLKAEPTPSKPQPIVPPTPEKPTTKSQPRPRTVEEVPGGTPRPQAFVTTAIGCGVAFLLGVVALVVVVAIVVQGSVGKGSRPDDGNSEDPIVEDWTIVRKTEKELVLSLGNGVMLNMPIVPGKGKSFWMGSPTDEKDRNNSETQHEVEFSYDWYMGEWEVTQAQYKAVTGKNPSSFSKDKKYADAVKGMNTDDFPVEWLNWDEAREFCEKLTEKIQGSGYLFRLPTEAEWEYSCRGGAVFEGKEQLRATTPFYLKNGPSNSLTSAKVNCSGCSRGRAGTGKCGSFVDDVNAFGLRDMHGNVSEWCSDWYEKYPKSKVKDPTGPNNGSDRVCRGGSYEDDMNCRAAFRFGNEPGYRHSGLGFRLAAVPFGK